MNVVLIGYRGSGKTTVGKLLADRLRLSFADTDELVRGRFGGMTIADIWRHHGEEEFRKVESDVVVGLLDGDGQVISLGGGAVMRDRTRKAIAQSANSLRVYLHCKPRELQRRIRHDAGTAANRPSLTGRNGGADGLDEITKVLDQREPTYRALADHVIDATNLTADQIAQAIIDQMP